MGASGRTAGFWPDLLSCLIAHDLLLVRIALTREKGVGSLYHEKIGFFADDEGRILAYSGSANESRNGLETNFERMDAYRGWGEGRERRRALTIQQHFQDLWRNRTEGLEVVDLATALQRRSLKVRESPSDTAIEASVEGFDSSAFPKPPEVLVPPPDITLFPHQSEAIFHGYNGAGKTALLNAFIWCLYGQTTSDLEAPKRLESERSVAEAAPGTEVAVSVRLVFIVHGECFIVERRRTVTKESDTSLRTTDAELSVWGIGPTGELNPVGEKGRARQNRIDQILPPNLYPFFFFNGERIERLACKDA